MSAIGDYVHFYQQNYITHGINKIHDTPSQKWNDAVVAFKNNLNISNEISVLMQQAKALQDQYNDLFYNHSNDNADFTAALQQFVQQKLDQKFGLMAGNFNSSNLSVDRTELYGKLKKAIDSTRKKIGKINLDKNMNLKTFMNRINVLQSLLEQNQFNNIAEIQPQLSNAKAELKQVAQEINKMILDGGGKSIITDNDIKFQKIANIIQQFNRVPLLYNQAGDLFEWVLPFIQLQSSNLAKQAMVQKMNELAKERVQGDTYIKIEMPDLLDNSLVDQDIIMDRINISTISTRSKTDVIISYIDNQNQLQTKNVSAKSITGKHIKLAQETTLYRTLLLSQDYNFATHYLNMVSGSSQGGWADSAQIYQANRLIKGLILKLGAQGYDANNPSELLIVNNRKEAHIYVYNLKALVYLIQKAMVQQGKYTNLIRGMSDNYKINQIYQKEGPSSRILNIIRETQNVKITAILSGAALNQYLNLLRN